MTSATVRKNRREWIAALRSGKYEQGKGLLRPSESTYCCLGVACDISGLGEWGFSGRWRYIPAAAPRTYAGWYSGTLPDSVQEMYGLSGVGEKALTAANDRGVPFVSIAKLIEECVEDDSWPSELTANGSPC